VDAGIRKAFDLRVEVPVEDMSRLGEEIAQAHHGSIAREQRVLIEDRLKAGKLPAMVATSSLELGIDMGAVDLVVQIETPPSAASGLQRIGRAGHQIEGVSRGVIFPKFRGDLLSTAAIARAMDEGRVEETRVPRNPLDVLTQQLVARHGILTRQAVLAEGVPGGFAALYPVLASLEEAGRLRRGYFLAGLGGAQFAQAGAVDRLRSLGESVVQEDPEHLPAVVLAAADPANPYGAALPWPAPTVASAPKPMRSAGARVILVDGMLAAFVRGDRDVATFLPPDEPVRSAVGRAAAAAVTRWAVATGRVHLGWATIDGVPAARSPFGEYLTAAGFAPLGSGFRLVAAGSADDEAEQIAGPEDAADNTAPRRRHGV
jgi:replicative superfamily II helicase